MEKEGSSRADWEEFRKLNKEDLVGRNNQNFEFHFFLAGGQIYIR